MKLPFETLRFRFFRVDLRERIGFGGPEIVFDVRGRSGKLGEIEWYTDWKQWVFVPCQSTIWSDGCLRDILAALAKIKTDYPFGK